MNLDQTHQSILYSGEDDKQACETSVFVNLLIPVLGVGVAAEAIGVKRKRCIWPPGSAACISCCPGPGMTVTP